MDQVEAIQLDGSKNSVFVKCIKELIMKQLVEGKGTEQYGSPELAVYIYCHSGTGNVSLMPVSELAINLLPVSELAVLVYCPLGTVNRFTACSGTGNWFTACSGTGNRFTACSGTDSM